MKKPCLALPLALCSSFALADHNRGFYAGASVAYINSETIVSAEANRDEIDLPALELNGGYKYNSLLGIDLRYGAGFSDRSLALSGTPSGILEYGVDSYTSIYYRPEITNKEAKIYALIGYSNFDLTVTQELDDGSEAVEETFSESGTSYGIGIGWFVDEHTNINVEYRMLLDKEEQEFSLLSLGLDYRFDIPTFKF